VNNRTQIVNSKTSSILDRRTLLKGAAIAGITAPFINRLVTPAKAQGTGVVNYAGDGGSYDEIMREVYFDPFEKETGIRVNSGVGTGLAVAKLQTMNSGGAEWDIVDLTNAEYTSAVRQDLILPMDAKKVDTSKLLPKYVMSHGFTYVTYVWVMGYNKNLINDADAPQSWADFWDTKRYAGKRTLRPAASSGSVIEAALFADRVTANQMYPIDVDRAFASLEKLGKDNVVWSDSLQEPVQRIGSGETPLGAIYTGRAILANRAGANIGMVLNQGIVGGSALSVIKNSNNKDEAFALLNFIATRSDQAAKFVMKTSYGTSHVDLESLLPSDADEIRATLPTNPDLQKSGLVINNDWWADNLSSVAARFMEWQLN